MVVTLHGDYITWPNLYPRTQVSEPIIVGAGHQKAAINIGAGLTKKEAVEVSSTDSDSEDGDPLIVRAMALKAKAEALAKAEAAKAEAAAKAAKAKAAAVEAEAKMKAAAQLDSSRVNTFGVPPPVRPCPCHVTTM